MYKCQYQFISFRIFVKKDEISPKKSSFASQKSSNRQKRPQNRKYNSEVLFSFYTLLDSEAVHPSRRDMHYGIPTRVSSLRSDTFYKTKPSMLSV